MPGVVGYKKYNWTTEKIAKLREIYPNSTKEEILKEFYPVKWNALKEFARKRNISRNHIQWNRQGTLLPLLENNLTSYYWMGFIAADGWISKTGQLVIQLHIKDKIHLDKLAKILNTTTKIIKNSGGYKNIPRDLSRIAVQDNINGIKLAKKFDIEYRKTYNPPSEKIIDKWTKKLATAFLIGFIDGDGSINKYDSCKIECHISWKNYLDYLCDYINLSYYSSISKRGYHCTALHVSSTKKLRRFIIQNNINVLERKWYKYRDK